VARQAGAFLTTRAHCQACGTPLSTKGHHTLTFRTLFGTIRLTSPQICHCPCTPHETATFSPLTELLPEHTAPELLFMETKWASLVSYGLTVQALTDFLPVDERRSVSAVRSNALAVAQPCEAELGEEQMSFIEGCPRDWGHLPIPDGPMTVGIDGGYVGDWDEKKMNTFQSNAMASRKAISCRTTGDWRDTIDCPATRLRIAPRSDGLKVNQAFHAPCLAGYPA
jgi:hypothetical protein